MTFRVIVGPIAEADLLRNANWWADHHSVEQAIKWIDTVGEQLQGLAKNPERFGYAAENGLFAYPLRQVLVGSGNRRSYRAVFTIKANDVYVLTVRRGAEESITLDDLPKSVEQE